LLALGLGLPKAPGLLNLDGTRNQLFVFGNVAYGYNSNVFSDATDRGDSSVTAELGLELKRRAGIIAVNSTLKFDYQTFGTYTDEDAFNPSFFIELLKTTGRLTGGVTVSAFRESRSDSAVNLRTNSWNFPVGLNLRYPINEKFYATSETGYLRRRYHGNLDLADYTDYSEALDLFYVYTSKLDLSGGYRIRYSTTSFGDDTVDHWFNLGATGGILPKLNGTLRVGYQIRDVAGGDSYQQFNILAALKWSATRKLTVDAQLSRDFDTIATGASVDSTSVALSSTYSFTRKLDVTAQVSAGRNKFLGPTSAARHDTFFGYQLGGNYQLNEHLRAGLSYTYFRNWSSLDFSDFDRHVISFDLSGRY
jgi:hypothetical protein